MHSAIIRFIVSERSFTCRLYHRKKRPCHAFVRHRSYLRTESLWCTADSSPLTWVITVCDLYRIHQNIPFPNRTTMNYLMNFLGWPLALDPQWFIYCKRQNLETNELNLLILNITGPKTNALVWKGLLFPKNVSEIIFVKIISKASRKLIT